MAPKEKEPRVKRAGIDPTMWAYLYAVVCIGLLIAGTSNSACALTFIIIANLGGFVVWVWTLVAMGMQSIVKAVIGGLCWVYMLYWLIAVCDNSLLKTWFGITLLMALLVVLAQVGIIPLEGLEELGLGKPSTLLEGVPDTERAYRVSWCRWKRRTAHSTLCRGVKRSHARCDYLQRHCSLSRRSVLPTASE